MIRLKPSNWIRALGVAAVAGIVLLAASTAQAIVLGNPVHKFKSGEFGVGLALDDFRETLFADIGVTEAGALQVLYGNFDVGLEEGTEYGVGYRHNIGKGFDVADQTITLGALAFYRKGTVEIKSLFGTAVELEYTQIYIGVGGSMTPVENLNVYGAGVYERIESESQIAFFGISQKVKATESGLGVLLGAEYWISENLVGGLELHPGLEDDEVAIFGEFKF